MHTTARSALRKRWLPALRFSPAPAIWSRASSRRWSRKIGGTTGRMQRFTRRAFGGLALAIGARPVHLFAANSIDAVLRSGADQRKIPAVVAIAGTANAITYSGAFGTRDAASSVAV